MVRARARTTGTEPAAPVAGYNIAAGVGFFGAGFAVGSGLTTHGQSIGREQWISRLATGAQGGLTAASAVSGVGSLRHLANTTVRTGIQAAGREGGLSALRWTAANQLGKGAVGAAQDIGETYVSARAIPNSNVGLTDYLSAATMRGGMGLLDSSNRTYASAAGSVAFFGAGFAASGGDWATANVTMQVGGMALGLASSGRDAYARSGNLGYTAKVMGAEVTGGVIGGVAGYMIGGWQGALQGASYGMMAGSAISRAFQACFTRDVLARARGTWGEGWRRFDLLDVGDEVLSRDEYNANGPLAWKRVEEKFVRTGRVWHLHFDGGRLLRTTGEHPFFAVGKGWVAASELVAGDLLNRDDGQWIAVKDVYDTGDYETVYNVRVADFHTYFVAGSESWGSGVRAPNIFSG